MREKLKHSLRAFWIGMSFPVVFSSGCAKSEKVAENAISIHQNIINAEKLSASLLKVFKDYFDSDISEYTSLESLLTDEEISEVIKRSKTTKECDYQFDGDIQTLEKIIQDNSIQYLKKHPEYESAFPSFEINPVPLNHVADFEMAFFDTFRSLFSNSSNNSNEDFCRIQTLKIVFSSIDSSSLGQYNSDDNAIVLNYQSILEKATFEGSNFLDELTLVLEHELNHVRQDACFCRIENGQEYENFNYIDGATSFFLESSAESSLYNIQNENDDDYTYYFERKYESLLFLLAVCNEKAKIEDYYNAIYDTSLEKLYEFFGCETEEDIYEFYKILGSMDASLGRNPNLDYSVIETVGDAERLVGYHYKVNIFHHILADMLDYTCAHPEFSLNDNLTLFKIVKTFLIDGSYTINESKIDDLERVYDSEFVSSFKKEEDLYYAFLSFYYDAHLLEMKQVEEDYADGLMDAICMMCSIHCDFSTLYNQYYDEAISLLEKFPLLEPICKGSNVESYMYDSFVEHNSTIYQKKK